jgi:hypothetical protein
VSRVAELQRREDEPCPLPLAHATASPGQEIEVSVLAQPWGEKLPLLRPTAYTD